MPPDPTPLTEAELNRLADLEAKATAAPWTTDSGSVPLGDTGDYEPYWFVNGNRKTNSQVASLAYCADEGDECDANMDLIASLRNAAPALLAAARENAGLREKYAAMKGHLQGPCSWEIKEPGTYVFLTRIFDDGSGFVRSVQKIEFDQDEYPCKEWKVFRDSMDELESLRVQISTLTAERDAALARVAELEKSLTPTPQETKQ